jgi:preprotein translocase SecE subunit
MQRSQKTLSLIYLFCAFIAGLLFREIITAVWVISGLSMPADWIVPAPDIMATVLAIVLFVFLVKNAKINEFVNEVITELSRVVWPNPKETVLSTGVVSLLVAICAGVFFLFDMLWGTLVRIVYS